ncbi:hypothetical protein [Thermomonospora umbrina]|uniref:Uncharacterized protein n=1 Tax=Thermomonospora umbrina TaxID=111806 RepID=A0A3D9T2M2_9ACTN|nr:hypothetical protein [Thermomonospora umbrina]REE99014.1 hypothetical protein DFJ69_4517 [Thermomonospora umbrina]
MDLTDAAHELYGVDPDAFMDVRGRLVAEARSAGDRGLAKEIGGLRKPTLSAWAVNLLCREAGADLAMLLDLGAGLREAWSSGGSIGGLEQRRGEVVALLLRTALRLASEAGHPLRDAAVREVENTLQAAAVDPEVAEDVRVGRLERPRSHSGFVPMGGTAPPRATATKPPPTKKRKADRAEAHRRAEEAARKAERRADEAARALEEWRSEAEAAKADLDAATEEADDLRRRLDEATERRTAAERRAHLAARELTRATRTADEARRKAEEAARR